LTAAQFPRRQAVSIGKNHLVERDHFFSLTKHDHKCCANISRAGQTGHNSNKLTKLAQRRIGSRRGRKRAKSLPITRT
jgi:hypothetical protein